MRTIHFKNGSEKRIDQYVADILRNIITNSSGALQWQCFSKKEGEKDEVFLMINLKEINYID